MTPLTTGRLKEIGDFESLIDFLKDELDWPLDAEEIEDLTFEYEPEEIGLSDDVAVNINFIKQLRPLAHNQPWGIFYIDFEPKKLPVVVLRRVLQKLIVKKRPTSKSPDIPGWQMNDLLFINSFGETDDRNITFAHFKQEDENQLPTLKVIGWDGQDTPLHLDRCLEELSHLNFNPDLDADQWRQQWSNAFKAKHDQVIRTSKALAKTLANLAQSIRETASNILKYEKADGTFHKTLEKFKQALIHDLTEDDFADMYAQTISYGLLYTAIRSHVAGEQNQVSPERVQQLVLPTNPFLKEVMEGFFNIGSRKWDSDEEQITGIDFDELGINDIVATLKDKNTDFDAVLRDFNNRNPNEDPVIHFYELFLKEYDSLKRKGRGVYYTPQPVVSFIVRSVHEVLKKDFDLPLGLADTTTWGQMVEKKPDIKLPEGVSEDEFFVQILDPATGTGTFLVETIDLAHKTMVEHWQGESKSESQIKKLWNKYVPDCLLPRLNGFELMMAPYAIAHMKIGIKLYETGYTNFEQDKKRVQIYLTNTLEKPIDVTEYLNTLDPAMAEETREANDVKQKKSLSIVIGNPPYSGRSWNLSHESRKIVKPYKYIKEKPIREKGALQLEKSIQEDYIKFYRYSQTIIDNSGVGIIGLVTSHGFLDNPTLRGMRFSLLSSFNCLHFLDLHGNLSRYEKCHDGSKDENVFDISKTGIAISILIKNAKKDVQLHHSELWGLRNKIKFPWLSHKNVFSMKSETVDSRPEHYLFIPRDTELEDEYIEGFPICEAMPTYSKGVVTGRDAFVIDFDPNNLHQRMGDFATSKKTDEFLIDKYNLNPTDWWNVSDARNRIPKPKDQDCFIKKLLYRPFDYRFCFYHPSVFMSPRRPVMKNFDIDQRNYLLVTSRMTKGESFKHVSVADGLVEAIMLSSKTSNNAMIFPLYLQNTTDKKGQLSLLGDDIKPNFTSDFIGEIKKRSSLDMVLHGRGDLQKTFGPEDILSYIISVLFSPSYRNRYSEFLKRDFPRIPITSDTDMFCKLVKLGSELISLHLMESDKLDKHITEFPVNGDNTVTKVGETGRKLKDVENGKGKLYINSSQYFDKLPEEIWNFHIGGYQVCYKWLADRKKAGRKLSKEDIEHYHRIVVALNETIKLMAKIDKTIESHTGWPIK